MDLLFYLKIFLLCNIVFRYLSKYKNVFIESTF
jgi:hypothetical protein